MTTTAATLAERKRAAGIAELNGLLTYALSSEADCMGPDSPDSPGAGFLTGIRDSVVEAIEYADPDATADDMDDAIHEVADSAVPIYTREKWEVFVDVGAYAEDPSEFGTPEDMDQAGGWALYAIARRLADALLRLYDETRDDYTDEPVPCRHCGRDVTPTDDETWEDDNGEDTCRPVEGSDHVPFDPDDPPEHAPTGSEA